MSDYDFQFELLKNPYGYREITKNIKKILLNSNFEKLLDEYKKIKNSVGLGDVPTLVSDHALDSHGYQIENTIHLSQALNLGMLAKDAIPAVKPFLYHYAENSLFAFFSYTLFQYQEHANNHGLHIMWDVNIDAIKVRIDKHGMFSRILDVYFLLGHDTHFSPFKHKTLEDGKIEFEVNTHVLSIINEPSLTIKELIELRSSQVQSMSNGHIVDMIDFVLLFFASSLSRYRPNHWQEIVTGLGGKEFPWFNLAFDRFELLHKRLAKTLIDLSSMFHGTHNLSYFDRYFEQELRGGVRGVSLI